MGDFEPEIPENLPESDDFNETVRKSPRIGGFRGRIGR